MASSPLSKIISTVVLVVIIIIAAYAWMQPSTPDNYTVDYQSKDGTITITLIEGAFEDSTYIANVYQEYSDSDGDDRTDYITHGSTVTLSSDRTSITVTDSSGDLVNMQNHRTIVNVYKLTGTKVASFEFNVNDHEYSTSELITIAVVVILIVALFAFAIVKRIIKGRWN